jgi:ferredoxin-NADP reductase
MLPRMAEIAPTLREIRPESPSASTLRLDLDGASFAYRPGQHVTIDPHQFPELGAEIREREAQRGKPLGPGYFSLSSDGIDASLLEITVKVAVDQPPGMLPSFLLRRLEAGRTVRLEGPGGKYGLPGAPPEGITGFLHLCGGGGVAPNRGMIRHALARAWPQRHLLLAQDRSEADVLFRREFGELMDRHPDALRVRRFYSRSEHEIITPELVRDQASGFLDLGAAWAFICGPNHPRPQGPGFVDRLRGELARALGFAPERIRTE